ncbi:ABC transporter substrate-binding protein [Mesobacillus maritimus]|uniref:ABC transporter substrate-binding protein n=1 Tax=Mesobacillus maritimus TaxID=1643336 RepID=UPI00203EEF37|nr:ABC transporter substrate-binding protein [Mesobacillus maritimus]MCM3584677.1 ABC transporter substrate-binding protein [Mesobacillus maritimus]
MVIKRKKKGIGFALSMILILSVFLAACNSDSDSGSSDGDNETIKVGIIGAFQLAAGKEIKDAAELAVKEINENGGVLGKKLEAVYADTKANPEEGRAVVERLLYQDEVDFIVGEHRSEVALAVQPVIMESKKIFVNTGSASPLVTEAVKEDYEFNKYTFRPMMDSTQLGEGFLNQFAQMVETEGYEKVALIAETAVWVDPIVETFEKQFGDKVVLVERPATDTEDFSIELSKLKDSGAEVAMTLFSANQGIVFAKQWAERQIPVEITGYNVQAQSPEFWNQTEGKANGLLTWKHGVRSEITEKSIPFWDNFTEDYGRTPGPYTGITAYDGVLVMADAINKAGTVNSVELVKTLESETFVGASGNIKFREDHGYTIGEDFVPFTYIQWQDGEMGVVGPESVATDEIIKPEWIK